MRTRGIHVHVYILFVTADVTRVLLLDENQGNTCTCIYTVCHCRCDSCVVTRPEPGNTCTCIYTVCHCRCDSCVVTR